MILAFSRGLWGVLLAYALKNIIVLAVVYYYIQSKPAVSRNHKTEVSLPLCAHFMLTTCQEAVVYTLLSRQTVVCLDNLCIAFGVFMYFIMSLIYELSFDLLHYLTHRALHHPMVYRFCHKVHHHFHSPSVLTAFYHHPLDIVITNLAPIATTVLVFSLYEPDHRRIQLALLFTYKTFTEVSGHSGKALAPASCFPQCIWLPRWLGIELYAEDHQRHHEKGQCNFSKRFSFWDKVFGTFEYVQ